MCCNLLSFFEHDVYVLVGEAEKHAHRTNKLEIKTMLNGLKIMSRVLKNYMAHRLRAKVQYTAIDEIKRLVCDGQGTRIMIVLDHKQKILGMKYREGQVDYFGKKGMSLLGSMVIESVNDCDNIALKYEFVDYVVKGYSGQDNVQVCAVLNQILKRVSKKKPQVKEICLQSDNASCFASQDLIPYIYSLNNEYSESGGP